MQRIYCISFFQFIVIAAAILGYSTFVCANVLPAAAPAPAELEKRVCHHFHARLMVQRY
jgi:hypothetical protein